MNASKPLLNFQQRLNRLRGLTLLLFLLLLIPAIVFTYIGFKHLQEQELVKYQRQTEIATTALNKRLFKRLAISNSIQKRQFDFYYHVYNPLNASLTKTLSPLSDIPSYQNIAGLIGYFQIDKDGHFNSPSWPYVLGSEDDQRVTSVELPSDLKERRTHAVALENIVRQSHDLTEFIATGFNDSNDKFRVFLDLPEYYIFYRDVKVNDTHKLQGYVLNRAAYLNRYVSRALEIVPIDVPLSVTVTDTLPKPRHQYFVATAVSNESQKQSPSSNLEDNKVTPSSNLEDNKVTPVAQPTEHLNQQVLGTQKLNWPFAHVNITYATETLTQTAGGFSNIALSLVLLLAMVGSCIGFYRIGVKQLTLAEQRLNFVSSVSHELKTPLTSIRMYAEMLQSGQVMSEQHQKDYYDFIFTESERLSRLIDNILQLAKLSQPQHNVHPEYVEVSALADMIRSKVSTVLERHQFKLNISTDVEQTDQTKLFVDTDAFSQVIINITDNAVKFFDEHKIQDNSRKRLDFSFSFDPQEPERVVLEIRDYGIGIEVKQEQKLFELFYRGGNELTRTTQGTGIGLALVKDLVSAQQGKIEIVRKTPGLALRISFLAKYT